MANVNMVNISSLGFCIWQHLKDHRNETQLYHLSSIPSIPIAQLYKHMISGIKPKTPFASPTKSIDDTESIWRVFSYTGVYVMAIGLLIPAFCKCLHANHSPFQSSTISCRAGTSSSLEVIITSSRSEKSLRSYKSWYDAGV